MRPWSRQKTYHQNANPTRRGSKEALRRNLILDIENDTSRVMHFYGKNTIKKHSGRASRLRINYFN